MDAPGRAVDQKVGVVGAEGARGEGLGLGDDPLGRMEAVGLVQLGEIPREGPGPQEPRGVGIGRAAVLVAGGVEGGPGLVVIPEEGVEQGRAQNWISPSTKRAVAANCLETIRWARSPSRVTNRTVTPG